MVSHLPEQMKTQANWYGHFFFFSRITNGEPIIVTYDANGTLS